MFGIPPLFVIIFVALAIPPIIIWETIKKRREKQQQQHQEIVDAIRGGDPPQAPDLRR